MSLYHYTDLSAVYSILKNNKIWMTDIRYLNDSHELHDGIKVLVEGIKEPEPDVFANPDYYEKARKYLLDSLVSLGEYGSSEDPLFVFSLSSEADCLSQWRAYGSFSIEFDEDILISEVTKLSKCIYENQPKIEKVRYEARDLITVVSNDMFENNGCQGPKSMDAVNYLSHVVASYKHSGFAEEQESRFIMPSNDSIYPNNILYRPKEDVLIPYIEVPITLDCIKSITVGPVNNQSLSLASLSEFVSNIEQNWQVDSGNIEYWLKVEKSKIPYRV